MINYLQITVGKMFRFSIILGTALKFIRMILMSQALVIAMFAMLLLFEGIANYLRFLVSGEKPKNKRKK